MSERLYKLALLLPIYERKLLEYILNNKNNTNNNNIDINKYFNILINILSIYESNENDDTFIQFKSNIIKVLIEFSTTLSTIVYNTTFESLSSDEGKKLSRNSIENDMKNINTTELGLTYGEITFNSFAAILEYCHPMENKTFVDIGCGTGKALIVSSLLFGSKLKHIHGVELVPGLYKNSLNSSKKYIDIMKNYYPDIFESLKNCKITVEEGDMLQYGKNNIDVISTISNDNNNSNNNDIEQKYDWTKADIVFANSTCFPSKLMIDLAKCAENMKKGK